MLTMPSKRSKPVVPHIPSPEEIKAIRVKRGLTIEEAAEKVGVRPSTWYGWETPSQNRRPSPSHAILIGLLARKKL